ncbi:MAG: phosphate ABC transporter substrate-binding protein PstS [Candidatus Sulfobium sp.]|jgi:phosphate transport system substrate-binding protein
MKNFVRLAVLCAAVLFFSTSEAAEIINGAGASFPAPVYQAWAYDYNRATGARLNYQSIGSGGGVRQITSRTVDFGASDAPVEPRLLSKENLLQFPAVIGGVVPVVNIRGIRPGAMKLDAGALCKIFLGDITSWNDSEIKNLNPGLALPAGRITVVHRSDGSGTTAIFTNYLSATCPAWKAHVGEGKAVNWPVGIGGKGNEGVANYVRRRPNSIGYVEFAYAKQNKLAYCSLKNAAGGFVEPTFKSFEDAAASAHFDPKKGFYLWLTDAPGKNSWPVAGATFILLAKEKKTANKKTVQFFDWAFRKGDKRARALVYVPLPPSLKAKVRAYWKANGL